MSLFTQVQIERAAGIEDEEIGAYISGKSSVAAKTAYELLALQVCSYDPAGMAMLKVAVLRCRELLQRGICE